jgi:hypothetical protein
MVTDGLSHKRHKDIAYEQSCQKTMVPDHFQASGVKSSLTGNAGNREQVKPHSEGTVYKVQSAGSPIGQMTQCLQQTNSKEKKKRRKGNPPMAVVDICLDLIQTHKLYNVHM